MSYKVHPITEVEKLKILNQYEGHFLDFKSKETAATKLTKHLSAFANADGGEMYIGIDEDNGIFRWNGFKDPEESNSHIQVLENYFPLGGECDYSFFSDENKSIVLRIEIRKSSSIKYAADGKVYLRRGAQSLPQNDDEKIERLKRNKGIISFETELLRIPIEILTESDVIKSFMSAIIPQRDSLGWLKKQLLIREEMPTVAGTLLFSDEPQAALPKRCGIKIYRYKTKGEASRQSLAFDPITIEGCIYNQIFDSVTKTIEVIQNIDVLGESSFEKITYPREAIHEIVTNAVIHRDYSITDDIHIRIFDNRVEVESPGTLPAHVNVFNILEERFARNGAIVRLINKFPNPPNKDVGEGLNTAFKSMRDLKLKDPVIIQNENDVLVIIKHEPLASPEEIIMKYLEENLEINNKKARDICFIGSENVVKRIFKTLISKNMIEVIPGRKGKATAYRKVKVDK